MSSFSIIGVSEDGYGIHAYQEPQIYPWKEEDVEGVTIEYGEIGIHLIKKNGKIRTKYSMFGEHCNADDIRTSLTPEGWMKTQEDITKSKEMLLNSNFSKSFSISDKAIYIQAKKGDVTSSEYDVHFNNLNETIEELNSALNEISDHLGLGVEFTVTEKLYNSKFSKFSRIPYRRSK